jgi:hypothetical protein
MIEYLKTALIVIVALALYDIFVRKHIKAHFESSADELENYGN